LLDGQYVLVCEAESHRDIERWMKLSDQFGLKIAISGGRDAWRVADQLAARDIPVFLTLNWGKEVKDPHEKDKKKKEKKEKEGEAAPEPEETQEPAEAEEPELPDAEAEGTEETEETEESTTEVEEDEPVWKYEEPLAVRVEQRREWEEKRDCALRLHEAGVRFAFGTAGEKPKQLLENVRALVAAGLPEEVALDALTIQAASLLGHSGRVGQITPGYDANLTLWTKNPLTEKKAKPVFVFVDGFVTEFERPEEKPEGENGEGGAPDEGVSLTGTWELEISGDEGTQKAKLTVEMADDGSVTGSVEQENPMDQSMMNADVAGTVSGNEVELAYALSVGEFEISVTIIGTLEGDSLEGEASYETPWSEEPMTRDITGTREPQTTRR